MHSSITPARIPPDITIVPADIRPALHQTLGREIERDENKRERGEGKKEEVLVRHLDFSRAKS